MTRCSELVAEAGVGFAQPPGPRRRPARTSSVSSNGSSRRTAIRAAETSQDKPSRSPSPRVSTMSRRPPGVCTSSATGRCRISQNRRAGSPSANSRCPVAHRSHPASPGEHRQVTAAPSRAGRRDRRVRRRHAAHGAPSCVSASAGVRVLRLRPAGAATSSVMSMPTGHHTMHRPQPTQPELPNWSCQVPSLWVSHCRYRLRAEDADRAAVQVGEVQVEAGGPVLPALGVVAGQVGRRPRPWCRSRSGRPSCSCRRSGTGMRRRPSARRPSCPPSGRAVRRPAWTGPSARPASATASAPGRSSSARRPRGHAGQHRGARRRCRHRRGTHAGPR